MLEQDCGGPFIAGLQGAGWKRSLGEHIGKLGQHLGVSSGQWPFANWFRGISIF